MRTIRSTFFFSLLAVIALTGMAQSASQQAQSMNHNPSSSETESGCLSAQNGSAQTGSGTVQPNVTGSDSSQLARYPDKPIGTLPAQPVSMHYVVEHRSALNGKTITVKGIVANTVWPSTGNPSSGEPSMSNPQPRIFLADNLRRRRDKNFDLMVLLREGERIYVIGQGVKIKVRVDSNRTAVMMRKVS